MTSRKRSARQRQVEAFKSQLSGLDDLYVRAERRSEALAAHREEALRTKACASKNRYATRWDAEEAMAWCAEQGRGGLSCYRCDYCGGWHLTSHPH